MAKDLAKWAKEKGVKYFMISYTDLFGGAARQTGADAGDQRHGGGRRGLCRFRHLA